jgi:hypothetical protein
MILIGFYSNSKFDMGEENDLNSVLSAKFSLDSDSLGLKIVRKLQNTTVFETDTAQMSENFFCVSDEDDYFNQVSMVKTKDEAIFGLGERRTNFKLRNGIYTIFPYEDKIQYDNGSPDYGKNLYGHHPFFVKVNNLL